MEMTVSPPLYMRVMDDAWHQLAESIRCLHGACAMQRAHGRFRVRHGRHYGARLLARALRLPRPSAATDTRLMVIPCTDGEQWQRTFNTRCLTTSQYHVRPSELAERFGVLEFRFRLDVCDGSLLYVQREATFRMAFVRLSMPASWAPRIEAREDPVDATRVRDRRLGRRDAIEHASSSTAKRASGPFTYQMLVL